jgi:hypothetical protein
MVAIRAHHWLSYTNCIFGTPLLGSLLRPAKQSVSDGSFSWICWWVKYARLPEPKQVSSRNEGRNGGFSLFEELPYAGPCLSKG